MCTLVLTAGYSLGSTLQSGLLSDRGAECLRTLNETAAAFPEVSTASSHCTATSSYAKLLFITCFVGANGLGPQPIERLTALDGPLTSEPVSTFVSDHVGA